MPTGYTLNPYKVEMSTFKHLLVVPYLMLLTIAVNAQNNVQYTVINRCPIAINLYIGGILQSNLASKGSTTLSLGPIAGFFFTDANNGTAATGSATRAGFFGDANTRYYYIVQDPTNFNTGISITTNYPSTAKFCQEARCDEVGCISAFSQPPTRFPPPSSVPPPLPVFSCPHANVAYTITFCPSGVFPPLPGATELHPNGNRNKCMDVRGGVLANGTPVQIFDCNGTPAQKWVLNRGGPTQVRVAGTNFCLDSTYPTPSSGTHLKIWQCYNDLPAQQWIYSSPNNKLTLSGSGSTQCMDLANGVIKNSNPIQTWQCFDGNPNQVWTQ